MKTRSVFLGVAAAALLGFVALHFFQVAEAVTVHIVWAGPNNPPTAQADNGDFEYVLRTTVVTYSPITLFLANTPGNNRNIGPVTLDDSVHFNCGIGEYPTTVMGSLIDTDEDGMNEMSAWDGTFYAGAGAFDKTILH